MKVGMDISQIAHRGGVASYTQALSTLLSARTDIQMSFFYASLRKPYKGGLKNVKSYPLPPKIFEKLFNNLRLPIDPFIGDVDIFHSSDWVQPATKYKKVTTYHDVVPLKFPQWTVREIISVHKKRLEIVEKEIDAVIAVSNATKQDLLEVTKIPKEKIFVIYEGVDARFRQYPEEQLAIFKNKYKLPSKFVLSIGGVGSRRNLGRVKEAVGAIPLIITGETIPWLEPEDMPLLYSSATLLCYPSFYEGFGLPVLEAMACGTPVITSNLSSLPEVGGNAVLYVDPHKTEEIKKAVYNLLNDNAMRKDLISKGLQQARKFSWEKCAEETVKLYKSL